MRILALDPGALRAGWAVIESEGSGDDRKNVYIGSGIFGFERDSNYQEYRLDLIEGWVKIGANLLQGYTPNVVVSEIVPPVGGNIASIINRQLGLSVITAVQTLAFEYGHPVAQIAASTVKKVIGGDGRASKVRVRDGVLTRLPDLESRRKEWTGKDAVWDEVDALAIALTQMETIG